MKVRKIRKRADASTTPIAEAHAPKVVWAIDFQFDFTTDERKFKIASMVDEHSRQSVLNMVEGSIPAEDLVAALEKVFRALGRPATGVAVRQRTRIHLRGVADVLRGPTGNRICSPWSAVEERLHRILQQPSP